MNASLWLSKELGKAEAGKGKGKETLAEPGSQRHKWDGSLPSILIIFGLNLNPDLLTMTIITVVTVYLRVHLKFTRVLGYSGTRVLGYTVLSPDSSLL